MADTLIIIAGGIKSITKDSEGNSIVTDNNGNRQTLPPDKNVAIIDNAGNGVIINKQGGETTTTKTKAIATTKREYNLSTTFENTTSSHYGIDQQSIDALKGNYEKLSDSYYVAWKAVVSQQSDVVKAMTSNSTIDEPRIHFIQSASSPMPNAETVTVSGPDNGMTESLVAMYVPADTTRKEQILGKLNIIGYDKKDVTLHIVPVNGIKLTATAEEVQAQLNKIYSQAVISWTVQLDSNLTVKGLNTPFDNGTSGLLSNYTGDMKTLINAKSNLNADEYYLFLVPTGANNTENGYMPRSKQAGFIFIDGSEDNTSIIHTMAHELGHGAFTLKHTFDEYSSLIKGTTDNLMDYANGTKLFKYQWDQIHDPVRVLGLFQSDESAASVDNTAIPKELTVTVNTLALTPDKIFIVAGQSLKLDAKYNKENASEVKFRLTIKPEGGASDILNPTKDWKTVNNNERWVLELNSVQEGKYTLSYKLGTVVSTVDFYVRKEAYDYACQVCGRNLSLSIEQVQTIFGGNSDLTEEQVNLFNASLKVGKFNTCHRVAHFFSQVKVETANFKALQESSKYLFHAALSMYKNYESTKNWYGQVFFETKDYLNYFHYQVYEKTNDSTNSFNGKNHQTYTWKASLLDTIRVPTMYGLEAGYFKKLSYTKAEIGVREKNFFSVIYSNKYGNGSPLTEDGYRYRGQGSIHLTWRNNYRDVSEKCNQLFGTAFDWENNPSDLSTNFKAAIYSGAAYFHYRLKDDLKLLDGEDIQAVSLAVNGGTNGLSDRKIAFNNLIKLMFFQNCKPITPKK